MLLLDVPQSPHIECELPTPNIPNRNRAHDKCITRLGREVATIVNASRREAYVALN